MSSARRNCSGAKRNWRRRRRELDAARDELELLGMPEEAIAELERTRAIKSVARITASRDGTLLERKVAIGQVIQPADTVFEIADLSSVWLVADVPEQQAGYLERGHDVEAEIAAFPGRIVRGKLTFVSSTVDPENAHSARAYGTAEPGAPL